MYRWPVRRRHGEKTLQAGQRGGAAEADAKRVWIVVRRHAKPARQALFTEGPQGVEPGYSEQEHDRAENERSSEQQRDGDCGIGVLQGIRSVVQIKKANNRRAHAAAQRKSHKKAAKSPERPESNAFPGYRARRFRLKVLEEYNQRRDAEPAEKEPGNSKIHDGAEGRKLLLLAHPLIGNFDIRAVIRHFVAQDQDIDSRVGVIRRVGAGG